MKNIIVQAGIALSLLTLTACTTTATESESKPLPVLPSYSNSCPDERPQICTMDYNPVCVTAADGSKQTYGNACSACGDSAVAGYTPGECQE